MWEKLNRSDAESFYFAARLRAVTASVVGQDPQTAAGEANLAMAWLEKAVAAGYQNSERLKTEADLNSLRSRDDFKALLSRLAQRPE